ncbi:MAG: cache domain-containing protein [Phycisphaeraceae bacterium]
MHGCQVVIRRAALAMGVLVMGACAAPGTQRAPLPEMPPTASGVPSDTPDSTEALMRFVAQAAGQVQREGRAALEAFAADDGPWQYRDAHLFVLDAEGEALHYDGAPHLVGQDLRGFTDTSGRPFVQWQLEALNNDSGTASAFYRWPRPQGIEPVWVASFAQRTAGPNDRMYLVGALRYELPIDATLLRQLAESAADRLRASPGALLREVRDPQGPWIYREAHVMVVSADGEVVAAPRSRNDALPEAARQWLEQQDEALVSDDVHGRRVRVHGEAFHVLAIHPE